MRLQSNPPSRCKNGHELTEENTGWWTSKRTFSGKTRICKVCMRERMQRKRENPDFKANEAAKMRRWRAENPERDKNLYTANRRRKKDWLDAQKIQCSKCSETHPACLEFHHRDPGKKNFLLSVAVAHYSLERIQEEAAKCDVICSNCHRKLHWEERQKKRE